MIKYTSLKNCLIAIGPTHSQIAGESSATWNFEINEVTPLVTPSTKFS
jgi:hypothetical protein